MYNTIGRGIMKYPGWKSIKDFVTYNNINTQKSFYKR